MTSNKTPLYNIGMAAAISDNSFDVLKQRTAITDKTNAHEVTLARIGSPAQKIYGGKYYLPPNSDTEELFYRAYVNDVLLGKKKEYMTEIQLNDGRECILTDIDFRYSLDTTQRLYTSTHVNNLIDSILAQLKKLIIFKHDQNFPLFVLERDQMYKKYKNNVLSEVKDGIHIIIGIPMPHKYQMLLRDLLIIDATEQKIFNDLNLQKGLQDVFDDKISLGTSGWQLYGSAKPGCEPYLLKQCHNMIYDEDDGEFIYNETSVDEFLAPENIHKNFHLLRARYPHHAKVEFQPNIQQMYEKMQARNAPPPPPAPKYVVRPSTSSVAKMGLGLLGKSAEKKELTQTQVNSIVDETTLDTAIDTFLKSLSPEETNVKDAHYLAQLLPEQYYKDGESHLNNRNVAFALKNTDHRLFLSWVKLRSKDVDVFNYGDIPDLFNGWNKYFNVNGKNAKTLGSLKYWARIDAPEEYEVFKNTNVSDLSEALIRDYTDGGVARLLYAMFGDQFICHDIKAHAFHYFDEHRWVEDEGFTLRRNISDVLLPLFNKKRKEALDEIMRIMTEEKPEGTELDLDGGDETKVEKKNDSPELAKAKKRVRNICDVCHKLDSSGSKNYAFREAEELFFDRLFGKSLDTNLWLLGCKNGVIDIKNKIFRPGKPTDYISKSTNLDYHPLSYYTEKHKEEYGSIVEDIRRFMSQIFPIPSLENYMWDHLSSVLIGEKVEQAFNLYVGSGSNGKSMIGDLMKFTLGEYYVIAPITMITEKRTATGSATPELMALKGARYSIFQEPDKSSPLNEGFVKQITGESEISGRQLFGKSEKFLLQTHFAACMNSLFDIKGCDDGIWRRIKIVMFHSKFADEGEKFGDETQYVFKKDRSLISKLPMWAPIFLSMLVERAFENQGVVKDCPEVVKYTNEYRQEQDIVQSFLAAKIEAHEKCQIGMQNLHRCFKDWYHSIYNNRSGMPKISDLDKAMNKKYGDRNNQANKKWHGVRIIIEDDNDFDDANDDPNEA